MGKRFWCALGLMAAASVGTAPAAAAPFSDLVVFGDSLVDAGNVDRAFAGLPCPNETPRCLGYFDGRFSNGYNFADYLSLNLLGTPTTASLGGGSNFAFGGARATSTSAVPDLDAQIDAFAAATAGAADPEALYLINLGGNDALGIVRGEPVTPAQVGAAIAGGVERLAGLGARSILVSEVVNVGNAPVLDGFEAEGMAVSLAVNAAIAAALDTLVLPAGTDLQLFDAYELSVAIFADPAAFGLSGIDFNTLCGAAGLLPECEGLAFVDGVHPTTVIHRIFGEAAFQQVPAPAALALFGLGLAALAARRRV